MIRKFILLCGLLGLTGCGLPPAVGIAGAALGAADVTLFHGCIGVQIADTMPWNLGNPYECVPHRYVMPGAPSGFDQITHGFTGTFTGQ